MKRIILIFIVIICFFLMVTITYRIIASINYGKVLGKKTPYDSIKYIKEAYNLDIKQINSLAGSFYDDPILSFKLLKECSESKEKHYKRCESFPFKFLLNFFTVARLNTDIDNMKKGNTVITMNYSVNEKIVAYYLNDENKKWEKQNFNVAKARSLDNFIPLSIEEIQKEKINDLNNEFINIKLLEGKIKIELADKGMGSVYSLHDDNVEFHEVFRFPYNDK